MNLEKMMNMRPLMAGRKVMIGGKILEIAHILDHNTGKIRDNCTMADVIADEAAVVVVNPDQTIRQLHSGDHFRIWN